MVEVRLFKHPREFIIRQAGPCFTRPPSGCYTCEACLTRGTYRCGGPASRVQLICSRRRAVVQLTARVLRQTWRPRLPQFGVGSEHLDAIDSAVMAEEPSLSNRRDDIVAMIEQVV